MASFVTSFWTTGGIDCALSLCEGVDSAATNPPKRPASTRVAPVRMGEKTILFSPA